MVLSKVARREFGVALVLLSMYACSPEGESLDTALEAVATDYVQLAIKWGEIDSGYVDAYYGPEQWREEALSDHRQKDCDEKMDTCIQSYRAQADELLRALGDFVAGELEQPLESRRKYLRGQLSAMVARMDMRSGVVLNFDEESVALYDAKAPRRSAAYFQDVLQQINNSLPGDGSLSERVNEFRAQFVIPKDRLASVFDAAIAECRKRTQEFIELPESEHFRVEYVTDKPWSGYNWYQGNYYSVIQVNTDLPIFIDRAVDLGCHEGYPGHHTYNVLLEQSMVNDRGWQEFTLYPLFSPQSLIAEGSANYGIEMAFPGTQRLDFEKDVLFPLAGLDSTRADQYFRLRDLLTQLSYAGNEAARRYLDGEWSREEAEKWLVDYALNSPERAAQRVDFFETYRSYVINYNLGQDIVAGYVANQLGDGDAVKRWRVFNELLASPKLPSSLVD